MSGSAILLLLPIIAPLFLGQLEKMKIKPSKEKNTKN
jgi:hypothetical protein